MRLAGSELHLFSVDLIPSAISHITYLQFAVVPLGLPHYPLRLQCRPSTLECILYSEQYLCLYLYYLALTPSRSHKSQTTVEREGNLA